MVARPEEPVSTARERRSRERPTPSVVRRLAASQQGWLDAVGDALQPRIRAFVSERPGLRNVLDGRWLGAPLHPVLTDVPIGAWTAAVLLDRVERDDDRARLHAADGALAVGIAAAVPAALHAQISPKVIETFQVGPNVYVRALAVEPARGALWVGTSAGLNEVDLESGKLRATLTRREGLASEQVFAIAIDAQGYKWIGTGAGGASRYRDGSIKTYFPMHGLADYRVFSFAQDARGAMWMGTLAGASRLERLSGKFTTYAKELVNEWVYGLAVDPKGQVWFATEGGVSMFDGSAWRAWTQADGLGAPRTERGNYILAVHAGKDGAIWAGTCTRTTAPIPSGRS